MIGKFLYKDYSKIQLIIFQMSEEHQADVQPVEQQVQPVPEPAPNIQEAETHDQVEGEGVAQPSSSDRPNPQLGEESPQNGEPTTDPPVEENPNPQPNEEQGKDNINGDIEKNPNEENALPEGVINNEQQSGQLPQYTVIDGQEMELIPEEEYRGILQQNQSTPPESISRYRRRVDQPNKDVVAKVQAHPKLIQWFKEKMEMMTTYDDDHHWVPQLHQAVNKFLTDLPTEKIFIWIENEKPSWSYTNPSAEAENEMMVFLKIGNENPTIDNISYSVFFKNIASNHLKTLLNIMNNKMIPEILKDKSWPDNVKKEFLAQLHKFMSTITETCFEAEGYTELYIPNEDLTIVDGQDKDLIQRLEATIINWNKQIREIVNNADSQHQNENSGPLDEIQYWRKRRENLKHIDEQLEKTDLKEIVRFLERVDSTYAKGFNDLTLNIKSRAQQASNNLMFLESLFQPCKSLETVSPKQIPQLLPNLLMRVRMIWEHSKFYKSNERISGLLHKISNEIIKRCKDQINVENMLDGDVEQCIEDLKDSITCGKKWRSIYDKMASTINKKSTLKWDFSSNSIFAQVEAFVQRCSELIEICEGQLQFAMKGSNMKMPKFGGSRSSEIINILFEIKASFGKLIDKFRASEKDKILDVKASTWHDEYNSFKSGMKELDVMYQNVIDYSFKQVTTVEQGVEMLEAFDYLAKRESIKVCIRKKATEVLNLFMNEVDAAKYESEQRKNISYPLHHGKFSGQAIFIRSLIFRIEKLKEAIDKLHFVDEHLKQASLDKFSVVYKTLEAVIKEQRLNSWKEENKGFDEMSNLNRTVETTTILCRSDDTHEDNRLQEILKPKPGHLQCNFDRKLWKLMVEVSAWKVLIPFNVRIPNDSQQFTSSNQQSLRVLKEYSMIVVRDYNTIIDYMDSTQKKLFAQHLQATDKIIQPGVTRFKWSSKSNVDTFLGRSCKSSCAQLFNKLKMFKMNSDKINSKCQEITSKMFIEINKKKPYLVSEFEQEQINHRKDVVVKLKLIFEDIFNILCATYEPFVAGRRETQLVWFNFVKEVDHRIEEALKKAVKNSLIELYKVVGDSEKNIQAIPIFILSVVLESHDNSKLNYVPSFNSLIKTVKETIESMNEIFSEFKSMQQKMLVIYNQKKQELMVKLEKEKNPHKKLVDEEEIKVSDENYYHRIVRDGDVAKYASKIELNLQKVCSEAMKDNSNKQWLNSYLLWPAKQKQKYTEDMINENWSRINNIRQLVENFDIYNEKIQKIKSTLPIGCIILDQSAFNQSLSEITISWQSSFLDYLREKSIEELTQLHNIFKKSEASLTPEPKNLQELKSSTEFWQMLVNTKAQKYESKLEPLKDKFSELDGHSIQFKQDETRMRNTLIDAWRQFNDMLVDIQKRNQKVRSTFQYQTTKNHQQFIKETGDIKVQFMANAPFQSNYKNQKANSILNEYKEKVNEYRQRWEEMKFGFDLFEINYSNPGDLDVVDKEIGHLWNVWGLREKWDREYQNDIKSIGFKEVNVDRLNEIADDYLQSLADFCKETHMKKWDVVIAFKTAIDNFKSVLPLIQSLREPCMRSRHWIELQKSIDFDPESETFTFDEIFVQKNFLTYAEIVNNTCEVAKEEFKIESALSKIKDRWEKQELEMEVYKKTWKIKGTDAVFAVLEDNMGTLSNQKTGIYYDSFKDEIEEWEQTLQQVSTTLDQLIQVQRQWIYLSDILASQDQQDKQLIGDKDKFQKLSLRVTTHMDRINTRKNVIVGLIVPDFLDDLYDISKGLDESQKILFSLLERKRRDFPRFYFLANDDLFELMGNSKDPKKVNKHIKKCFEGIKKLTIASTQIPGRRNNDLFTHDVIELVSPEEEIVKLSQKITCENGVENWVKGVEKNMRETLKKALYVTFNNFTKKKDSKMIGEWIENHLGQLLIVASQIIWTNDCQAVLRSINTSSDKPDKSKHWKIIKEEKSTFLVELTKLVRKTSKLVTRLKLVALITIEVHARDITQQLSKTCTSINSFEWKKQLRFSGQNQGDMLECIVEQTSTRFPYGYEYQGNNGRLVVTALTDRCYMTLTTAMHLKKGGAPQGPAGTGKTETVKDLGKGMGKFVLVFNCSEGLDYKSLGRMFSGLMQTGGWGCFDEFNRIQLQVLSVVAQQMLCILNALKELEATKDKHSLENPFSFTFQEANIPANDQCAIFITMNPGYAGRSQLPDNLKSLFRPISMMVPQANIICEIMLSSQGFKFGKMLSTKMVVLYTLMSQQLSKQDHYDFGLRAIKSVLTCAGAIRRDAPVDPSAEKVDKKDKELMKELEEQELRQETSILMKAINDMNMPKFVAEDTPLFRSLFTDLFPGMELSDYMNEELSGAIKKEMELARLIPNVEQIRKIIQLYDSKNTRHGNMLVGASLSGKSTCWKILKNAMNALNKQFPQKYPAVRYQVLNPKTVDLKELFGYVDISLEWSEGVLSSMMSRLCKDQSTDQRWMILDGPVDTFWIESMNTVLDDNKVLTLLNGDRISLPPQVGLVFEVEDLAVASPATVSRAGMIYLNITELGWSPLLQSWILKIKDQHVQEFITGNIEKWLPKLFAKKKANKESFKELIPISQSQIVLSFTKLMDAFIATQAKTMSFTLPNKTEIYWNLLQKWMAFCLVWSFGATLDENGRRNFDGVFRDIESMFPSNFTVFDYYINNEKNEWIGWEEKINAMNWKPPNNAPFHKLLVPTVQSARNRYVLMNCVQNRIHTLSIGVTGTGKTVVINEILSELDESVWKTTNIIFSSQTSSQKTQEMIEGKLTRRSKTKMVPDGKKMVIYVDDLNMPKKDTFGSQPPLELIRQWMDYEGWFDRQQKEIFKKIEDIQFISSMGPPGGGRAEISRRVLTKFNIVNFTFPSDTQVRRIFQTILSYKFQLQQFQDEIKPLAESMSAATINLYQAVSENFLPTPAKSHYVFNMRDISKVIQGIYVFDKYYCDSKVTMFRLWVHEALRVFHDRLVSFEDRDKLKRLVAEQLEQTLSTSMKECTDENQTDTIFVDFFDETQTRQIYIEVPYKQRDEFKRIAEEKLEEFNDKYKSAPMNIVLFDEALSYLCKVHRIIKFQKGHGMLVGEGGAGRKSITKLACFIAKYDLRQISASKNYKLKDFRENIKDWSATCVYTDTPCVLMFSDNQITDQAFVEDINTILTIGEIPNLFQKEDYPVIKDKMRTLLARKNKESKESFKDQVLLDEFFTRVQNNFHIVFLMSKTGDNLRNYCRMYPGLVNNTTLIWFMPWPSDALVEVANQSLKKLPFEEDTRKSVSTFFGNAHTQVMNLADKMFKELRRLYYVTPTNYIELVKGYTQLLKDKQEQLGAEISKLTNGLFKLDQAQQNSNELQKTLAVLQVQLAKKSKDCQQLLIKIDRQTRDSKQRKTEVQEREILVNKQKSEMEILKAEAEEDLKKAEPALVAAEEGLLNLTKDKLSVVKSYTQPPVGVDVVLNAVMILLNKEPNWNVAKKELADTDFMKRLKELKIKEVTGRTLLKIEKLTQDPKMSLDRIDSISEAAGGLWRWVLAVEGYAKAFKDIEPKRVKCANLELKLAKSEEELNRLRENFEILKNKLDTLTESLQRAKEDMEGYQKQAQQLQMKLERADKLINGLASTKIGWEDRKKKLEEKYQFLVGDALMSAAFLSYAGPFPSEYRESFVKNQLLGMVKTLKIPHSKDFNFPEFLIKPVEFIKWQLKGLPDDNFSKENGVLVKKGRMFPLLIDPQQQGNKWIRDMEKELNKDKLFIIDPRTQGYTDIIKKAISFGNVIILQNLEQELDATMEPLLNKNIKKVGGVKSIYLGEEPVRYDDNFRFYMTTKLPNPKFKAEVTTKVTLINFTVKEKGLEQQLTSVVIRKIEAQLENNKNELIKNKSENQEIMKKLDDDILKILSTTKTNLIDDENIIVYLQQSKETEEKVRQQIETSATQMKKIYAARENYKKLAKVAAKLFFIMNDFALIESMYQFALDAYIFLFEKTIKEYIEKPGLNDSLQEKLEAIAERHKTAAYRYACRGLFEKDKLLLGLMMTVKLKDIDQQQYSFFLRGGADPSVDRKGQVLNQNEWIEQSNWNTICDLEKLPNFTGIIGAFTHNAREWKRWYMSAQPEKEPLPGEWNEKCDSLRKMILVKIIRRDRVLPAAISFIVEKNGSDTFVNPPNFSLDSVFNDSNKITPIIFILSPGVDPHSQLEAYAKLKCVEFLPVSLGQGQAKKAKEKVFEGAKNGTWLYLANCHLSLNFLKDLEKIMETFEMNKQDVNENFRLWLSTNPHPKFPISILQKCIKITTQPPKGLKANMLRLYSNLPKQLCPSIVLNKVPYKRSLFSLCFFHAVIIERRRFKTLGWNIIYDFNDSDWETADKILQQYIDETQETKVISSSVTGDQTVIVKTPPWDAIRYLISEVTYGGRVTDEWDRRLLNVYASEYFNQVIISEQKHPLGNPNSNQYLIPEELGPKEKNLEKDGEARYYFKKITEEFPPTEKPEVFGQHINAEISSQIADTNSMLESISTLESTQMSGGEDTMENKVKDMIKDILETVSEEIDLEDVIQKVKPYDDQNPLKIVLIQEISRYNKLVNTVRTGLINLQKGINGLVLISEDLEIIMKCLFENKVPEKWKFAYHSLKPLSSWILDLNKRVDQLKNWAFKGQPNVFWISGFSFPTGFTTALQQQASRKFGVPIDQFTWQFAFQKMDTAITIPAKEGAYIQGLFLQGAKWDGDKNCISQPQPMKLFYKMPIIQIKPVSYEGKQKGRKGQNFYQCPTYMYPIRTGVREKPSFMFTVQLPCKPNPNTTHQAEQDFWIKRGTALLMSLATEE